MTVSASTTPVTSQTLSGSRSASLTKLVTGTTALTLTPSSTATASVEPNRAPTGGVLKGAIVVVPRAVNGTNDTDLSVSVVLVATGIVDPDGALPGTGSGLLYQFSYIDPVTGSTVTLPGGPGAEATLTVDAPVFSVDTNVTYVVTVTDPDGGVTTRTVVVLVPGSGLAVYWLPVLGVTATRWDPSTALVVVAILNVSEGEILEKRWSATYWNGTHYQDLDLSDTAVAVFGDQNASMTINGGVIPDGATGEVTIRLTVCLCVLPCCCAVFPCRPCFCACQCDARCPGRSDGGQCMGVQGVGMVWRIPEAKCACGACSGTRGSGGLGRVRQ